MRKITNIAVNNYFIICTLDNGEKYCYDMNFVKTENHEMLKPLRDINFFKKVYLEYGSLAWPNGYDIHVNTIIREGKKTDEAA
jgi:hypothetical protein